MSSPALKLIATTAFGLESVLALELRQLGYEDLKVTNGRVAFYGYPHDIARCNLWLRTADRLLICVGEFAAMSFDELFEQTKALPWEAFIPRDGCFPVAGKSIRSHLFSVSDCQAIVKKAIVERLKQKYPVKWFEETGSRFSVEVGMLNDVATLTIDTSGPGLHKRGYRDLSAPAPIKETLAAALVILSRWKPDRPFIDPCCGSGTIPIEAALIGKNIAPGLKRKFAAEQWNIMPSKMWQQARAQAQDEIRREQKLGIQAYDIEGPVLSLARHHAKRAGVEGHLSFQQRDIKDLGSRYHYGYLIANPPYGERLAQRQEAEELYRVMGRAFKKLDTWSFYIISSHPGFEAAFGRRADKKRKLYNGRIQCNYYQFYGPRPEQLKGPF
ncbi:MAG: class I SAM-dependent RNA methyltransferase [Syntrophomonadaceae bacterium]|nr:class I SAM-dependent RNA methyltransferase [Syntrophomonadaceae bacterium]